MKKCFLWLFGEERTASERVMLLILAGFGGFLAGILVSPFQKITVGSYNGSYNEGNSHTSS